MAFWLMKSEPDAYSWAQMAKDKKTVWSGVRNYQAAGNMKKMAVGDEAFFYHSVEGKEIVGIIKITKTYHPDPADKENKFGMVGVTAVKPFRKPVTLAEIKTHARLKGMAFVRQSRLSVSPVTKEEWHIICKLGET